MPRRRKSPPLSCAPTRGPFEPDDRLFADIFRMVPTGLVIWRLEDPENLGSFRVIAANPACDRFLTPPPTTVLGTSMQQSYPDLLASDIPRLYAEVIHCGCERDLGDVACANGGGYQETVFAARAFPLPDRCVCVAF